jgi:signal transduction histidine kinase
MIKSKQLFFLFCSLFLCCAIAVAQEAQKSALQQKAEEELRNAHPVTARYTYIKAYEDYANQGKMKQSVECAIKATELFIKNNEYKEAFDMLYQADVMINNKSAKDGMSQPALHYMVSKERMDIYMRLNKTQSALEHINVMERYAEKSGDEDLKNDALYNKAIYYYTIGQNTKGNEVFEEMAAKLTASKEYDKVDKVYQTLISNSRKSGNASLLSQSYKKYILWKDSVSALKVADEIGALKKQIAENEASIADKDSSLTTRWMMIVGLCIIVAGLAVALVVGAVVLMRFILLTRKQKKVIKLANDNNALKAKFISNISAQLDPTLKKLDSRQPEVDALIKFSEHIQQLSVLENSMDEEVEMEEVQVVPFCESIMDAIRSKVKSNVTLHVNTPKMSALINKEYVSHILTHLLNNAVEFVTDGGTITLEYKKRGAHSHQFLVSNTGATIEEEKREDIFKAFREIRDLTKGDGLGLPTCKQMALKMKGDLIIDPEYTKGTRFVLELHG